MQKPAIIACKNCNALRAITAYETTSKMIVQLF